MRTLPMTGKPGRPYRDLAIILVLVAILFLSGCTNKEYQAVPLCKVATPPDPDRFIKAGVDERLVLMTNSYITASRYVGECNNNIKLINNANKASK